MNPRLLATALMLAGATAACTPEQQAAWDNATGLPPTPRGTTSAPQEPAPAALFVAAAAPLEPEPETVELAPEPQPEPCVSIFRVQTCEDGVLHHLGPNMEWID